MGIFRLMQIFRRKKRKNSLFFHKITVFWENNMVCFSVFARPAFRPYLCNMKRNNRTAEMFGEHFKE